MTLADRLKKARNERGYTQNELAVKSGALQQAINRIESGATMNPRKLTAIAEALGMTEAYLRYGVDGGGNVGPAPVSKGDLVPVISWVTAGQFEEFEQLTATEEWCPRPAGLGDHCFGLRVQGDSMESPVGRSIPNGAIIYVDPDAPVENGSLVVARSRNQATFKEYAVDSGVQYLKPLNSRYPLYQMEEGDEIIGVVKKFIMDL